MLINNDKNDKNSKFSFFNCLLKIVVGLKSQFKYFVLSQIDSAELSFVEF